MKVFSLYHLNKFVASFSSREESVAYGKSNGGDPWDYDVIEEYLSKSPPLYSTPYIPPASSTTPINSVKPEPYKDVSVYWEKK